MNTSVYEPVIDGMTRAQLVQHIDALGHDLNIYACKHVRAHSYPRQCYWEQRIAEATRYLIRNLNRLSQLVQRGRKVMNIEVIVDHTPSHHLQIQSLRDLHATCRCGHWEYTYPTTHQETDAFLRAKAWGQWDTHRHGAQWETPS